MRRSEKFLSFLRRLLTTRDKLLFILVFGCMIFATVNMNFRNGDIRPPGKIWSDAAHYYVYMPATMIYHWNVYEFPYKIEKRFEGFLLNGKTGKVEIKTTCGIAILLFPFFLLAHLLAMLLGLPMDGFSTFYQFFMMLGSVFYMTLGLYFLKKFLERYLSPGIAVLSILLLALTTQVYFYGIHSVLMSHIYSFFLFSLYLYLLKRYFDGGSKSPGLFILISVTLSLAFLLRPTNIIIILWMAFLDVKSHKQLWKRILHFLHPARSLVYIAIQFLVLVPQFMYWKYLSGHFIYYSYPGEVFYWFYPQIIKEWFSPLNGLFMYHPVYFLFVAGSVIMIVKNKVNGWLTLLFFIFVSYVISCWHCWYYGGSFGARPFTEYTAFFVLPFAFFIDRILSIVNLFMRSILVFLIMLMIYFNFTQTYNIEIFTGGTWSWDDYFRHMRRYELLYYNSMNYNYKNDFQAVGMQANFPTTNLRYRSRVLATYCDTGIIYNPYLSWDLEKLVEKPVEKISARLWVNPVFMKTTGAKMIMRLDSAGRTVYAKSFNLDDFVNGEETWVQVKGEIMVPEWIPANCTFVFFVFNEKKNFFCMDDLEIDFE